MPRVTNPIMVMVYLCSRRYIHTEENDMSIEVKSVALGEIIGAGEAPFEYMGITDDMYMELNALKDKTIEVVDVKPFENDKGPGVYIAFTLDGKYAYTTTHAVGLVGLFTRDEVVGVLAREENIVCTIRQKVSKKTGFPFFVAE